MPKKAPSEATRLRNVAKLRSFHYEPTRIIMPPPLIAPPRGEAVAIDLETHDPSLMIKGSSWAFPDEGRVIGVGLAWNGFNTYYPIDHLEGNVDAAPVWAWLRYVFEKRPDLILVFAHANYDLGWLQRELRKRGSPTGFPVGMCCDVQFMAALFDENRLCRNMVEHDDDEDENEPLDWRGPRMGYSLDSLAFDHLGKRKASGLLERIEKDKKLSHKAVMGMLEHIPGFHLMDYGAGDARLTVELYHRFMPILREENLLDAHRLESKLIPISVKMRQRGVRVDLDATQRLIDNLKLIRIPALIGKIKEGTGVEVAPWENESLGEALRKGGVPEIAIGRTGKTQRTEIRAPVLEQLAKVHPIAGDVLQLRKLAKIQTTFLEGHLIGHAIKHGDEWRVHASFNQLRSEQEGASGGTVTGRYSCSDPNLQQLPMRDDEFAKAIRGAFLHDRAKRYVGSADYSGQELRLMAHYAYINKIPGGDAIHKAYNDNPRIDLHQYCAEVCGIKRYPAKTMNFRIAYGAGGAAIAKALGMPTAWKRIVFGDPEMGERDIWEEIEDPALAKAERAEIKWTKDTTRAVVELAGHEAADLLKKWREGMPFIAELSKACKYWAQKEGYLVALGNRRVRLVRDYSQKMVNGQIQYLSPHKSMNKLIQCSAAEQTKRAMLAIEEEGNELQLTIHDELVLSVDSQEEIDRVATIMRDVVCLSVPTVVDGKIGASLGEIDK